MTRNAWPAARQTWPASPADARQLAVRHVSGSQVAGHKSLIPLESMSGTQATILPGITH